MHPGAWLVWATAAATVAATTTNPFYLLPLLSVAWVVYATARAEGPWARSFRVFLFAGLIVLSLRTSLVLFGPFEGGSALLAFLEGLRLAVLLAIFGTFNAVTDPFRLLKLAPRRFHEPALAAALALSMAPRTAVAARRVLDAQRLRGIAIAKWRSWPALVVPVLATGMDDALTLAESMDARGHGRGRRSRYRPERWDPRSVATLCVSVVAAALFVIASFSGTGGLGVSAFPLTWPEVSPSLVTAIFALGLPALLTATRRER